MRFDRLIRLLVLRRNLEARDQWSRSEMKGHQAEALRALRDHAYSRSPFYRRYHQGLMDHPLEDLPVLTKADLMNNWDDMVTDRSLKLTDVQAFIKNLKGTERLRGRYYVSSTAGSTGLKGIFVYSPEEWNYILASYTRANDWAGVKAGLMRRLKVAVVSTTTPWHQSAVVGATLNSWFVPTLRIDSTDPMDSIVERLNRFQPRSLIAYAGMARVLALEQLGGRLRVSPEAIFCASEVLTEDTRKLIRDAWGKEPTNVFAATETAGIASECTEHHGLHIYEDLVIVEAVDEHNLPVPPGEFSAKILVTVLFSRTIPLIRYELTDSIRLAPDGSKGDLPFITLDEVQGRMEDVVVMSGRSGGAAVIQPNVFHNIMEAFPVKGWQVVQESKDSIKVFVVDPGEGFSEPDLVVRLTDELTVRGALAPMVQVEQVHALAHSSLGKTFLVRALTRPH